MPVAVRLSKNFYDRFGDEATNELVTLLNDVDLTYRSELRDAFAGNIAVFDAKLAQRLAEQDARIDVKFTEMDAKFEMKFAAMDAKFEKRFAGIDVQLADLRGDLKGLQASLLRWMFGFWAASTITTVTILIGVLRTR